MAKNKKIPAHEKALKNLVIVYRPYKAEAAQLAKDLAAWLKLAGVKVFTHPDQKTLPGTTRISGRRQLDKMDLVVVLGGDGTYLKAVKMLAGKPVPVLGVNLGSLGFLTEIRVQEVYKTLELALQQRLETKARTLLEVEQIRKGKVLARHLALNDLVIERGASSRLIHMSLSSQGQLVTSLKADGLIVAGPTGSTAYNLAAGGPILHPEVKAFVVTPICPHSLTERPLTLPDDHNLRIKILAPVAEAFFMVDGFRVGKLKEDDEVSVKKASELHFKMAPPSLNYFDLLRSKLSFGKRD